MTDRLSNVYALLEANHLDALVLNPGPTLTYLTGLHFHLMERPTLLILSPAQPPALILPELEAVKASQSSIPLRCYPFSDNPATWIDVIRSACLESGLESRTIGVEPTRFRFLEMNLLQQAVPSARLVSGEAVTSALRIRKVASEIAAMRKAVKIAQEGLLATIPSIKPGMTEIELAAELTVQLLRAGTASEMPFAPIVASGPNSANPHAVPTTRRLQMGDLLVIDWGAAADDYCSDLTRTFSLGEPSAEFATIAKLVLGANEAGRAVGKPGLPAGAVDDSARKVIQAGGYGKFFTHRTGHGLGMEGHEPPYMFAENRQILEPGMAYTVEPGIYLPGLGGVRIEDDVIVTETGGESLSDLPRQLHIIA